MNSFSLSSFALPFRFIFYYLTIRSHTREKVRPMVKGTDQAVTPPIVVCFAVVLALVGGRCCVRQGAPAQSHLGHFSENISFILDQHGPQTMFRYLTRRGLYDHFGKTFLDCFLPVQNFRHTTHTTSGEILKCEMLLL
jgi:hypothetical protein